MNQLPIDTSGIDTPTKKPSAGKVELLELPAANHYNTKMMSVCLGSVKNANAIIMTAKVVTVIRQFHITWSVSLSQGGPLKLKHKFDKHGNQCHMLQHQCNFTMNNEEQKRCQYSRSFY